MMQWLRFGISAACMVIGLFVFCCGVFGIYRFRFVLNRMHAAAVLDTMGLFFVLMSLAVARGFDGITLKGFLILVFLWTTGPISSHLIAKMEFLTDRHLDEELGCDLSDVKGNDNDDSGDL